MPMMFVSAVCKDVDNFVRRLIVDRRRVVVSDQDVIGFLTVLAASFYMH